MTTQGPIRYQVLVLLTLAAAEIVVANAVSAVEPYNKGLVSVSISTNSVVFAAELEVIKQ